MDMGHPLPNLIRMGHLQFPLYEATSASNPLSGILVWGYGYVYSVFHLELAVPLDYFRMLCSHEEKRMSLNSMFRIITQRKGLKSQHVPVRPGEQVIELQSHFLSLCGV